MQQLEREFEFCKRSEMKGEWRNGIPTSHRALRENLLALDKPPTSYKCKRCGKEVIPGADISK